MHVYSTCQLGISLGTILPTQSSWGLALVLAVPAFQVPYIFCNPQVGRRISHTQHEVTRNLTAHYSELFTGANQSGFTQPHPE